MSTHPILAFKAGRAFRRANTNFVDPDPAKGILAVHNEDGLLHLTWKNRQSGEVEDDLILFPADVEFKKVSQSAWGRTYVLQFASSNQRHFYWMQDASTARDQEIVDNLNGLMQDSDFTPVWSESGHSGPSSSAPAPSAPGQAHQPTAEQLRRLREIMSQYGTVPSLSAPDVALSDILTPANLAPLFTSENRPLLATLFPHLPPDLPGTPDADTVRRVVESVPFQTSVRQLDQALATGLLSGLVRGLGLPEEAGLGVAPFLRAISEQARRQQNNAEGTSGDHMETD